MTKQKSILLLSKIFSIVLIISIFMNTSGYVFVFSFSQKIIKKEIKQLLKKSLPDEQVEFLKIKIGDPNYRKIEKNEFIYNNKLYDIIELRIKNGFMYIRCINDQKEEQLFKNLDDLISSNFKTEGARGNILNKLYSMMLFLVTPICKLLFQLQYLINYSLKNLISNSSFVPDIPTPPPEISLTKHKEY